ncbi:hypothetical protein ACT17_15150 [Mycolicibacterium conceptionense]|uniref:Uncharacterized protein n=1 Tax=Mycolicibacterium conceptionense TaxID=451644 RepID=A0A0J8U9D1_9MYCO|nr:hypothetical protein [Mycolicibacterium conceptionense]KMV17617.1 hypothetical protein ACT17_15150 [Mycolicibacterium conceptionense]
MNIQRAHAPQHVFARALLRSKNTYARYAVLGDRLLVAWDTRKPVPPPLTIDDVITTNRRNTPASAHGKFRPTRPVPVRALLAESAHVLDTGRRRRDRPMRPEHADLTRRLSAAVEELSAQLAEAKKNWLTADDAYSDLLAEVSDAAGLVDPERDLSANEVVASVRALVERVHE